MTLLLRINASPVFYGIVAFVLMVAVLGVAEMQAGGWW